MPTNVQILPIVLESDGTNVAPATTLGMSRNDSYYLDKIADRWAKDRSLSSAFTYRLERLPHGYSGYERQRETGHWDRVVYGHPGGVFRSLIEFYPHFRHLQDHRNTTGCACKLCSIKPAASGMVRSEGGTAAQGTGNERPQLFGAFALRPNSLEPSFSRARSMQREKQGHNSAGETLLKSENDTPSYVTRPGFRPEGPAFGGLPEGRFGPDSPPPKCKQVDANGAPDVFRILIDKLYEAGPAGSIDEEISDTMSPDWRAGHEVLDALITDWQALPKFVPRVGELVLFARTDLELRYDTDTRLFRHYDSESKTWLGHAKWETGVVTQTPTHKISEDELHDSGQGGESSVVYSGFRVEMLSPPVSSSSGKKRRTAVRHKFVPLRLIRPFAFWQYCIGDKVATDWPESLRDAMAVSSSFSLLSKFAFKGTWPSATIFVKGLYIGPELLLVGDAVRLLPRPEPSVPRELQRSTVIDIMVITSIRLCLENLDDANDDDYDDSRPYTTCLHVQGKPFTLLRGRSFGGVGKHEARPGVDLPASLAGYGQWYHVLDPTKPNYRLEIPYTRLLGRCHEFSALDTWFGTRDTTGPEVQAPSASKAAYLSYGASAIVSARKYSTQHDSRIQKSHGRSWFWADTRIEQLDLPEVNGRFVGSADPTRTVARMNALRKALKVLDGKKGSIEEYHAAKARQHQHEVVAARSSVAPGAYGMVVGAIEEADAEGESQESDDGHMEDESDDQVPVVPRSHESEDDDDMSLDAPHNAAVLQSFGLAKRAVARDKAGDGEETEESAPNSDTIMAD